MQLSTFFVTFLATAVLASPAKRGYLGTNALYDACTGIYSSAQCCATDALGVADLDCSSPSTVPITALDFKTTCALNGLRARCCILPVAGQGVLCQTPVGV
ncbi:Cerato-ulmin hydrophobin family [Daldinia decipiens]|uniref:Cerato-ulmin hydrophobin family n=1 Tax=Daldinia decipiens TaxID=326647 RepID=UPI0020C54ADF|nr:Cerato-ulmin hydrophobin family [Daldinia decipiens]KAI1653672.1 Cerato-ulmin hydrophobin family [Daldinia decipiens]